MNRKDSDRARRDVAGVGPDPTFGRSRLVSLGTLKDYRIRAGEPDIRGWDVCTLSGREVGEVEDLLVDPERHEIVMLDVELRERGMHAEVPIRSVQLDRSRKLVLVDSAELTGATAATFADRADTERLDDRTVDPTRERMSGDYLVARDRADLPPETIRRDDGVEETVIERRPVVEEVVIRRRVVDSDPE